MTLPLAALRFRHPWRSYQSRVLGELEHHLGDRKLHIVAAPGAGKTVLGLEVVRRLNRRTLVLAPSLLIRDQWAQRLQQDFNGGVLPDWVSLDLDSDAVLRLSTYQAFHTARARTLPGFDVLVLDEAHHLRRAWWQALTHAARTHDPVTVALTATPPWDVDPVEWRNYTALCGPVDAEISVPELVAAHELSPHQDLVWLARPADCSAYRASQTEERALFSELRARADVIALLEGHSWIALAERHAEAILERPELFSAMVIYLRDAGRAIPRHARRVLQVTQDSWPALDWTWLQVLFDGLRADLPAAVTESLLRARALQDDRLSLPPGQFIERAALLQDAEARRRMVCDIHALERGTRREGLRMAVLMDRIGRSELDSAVAPAGFNLGALFRSLQAQTAAQAGASDADLAVLAGPLAVLPDSLAEGIAATTLQHAPGYVVATGPAQDLARQRIEAGFAAGRIRVILGTHAYLGQGWDAPRLNVLVLATGVRSFVTVNQLRGRALRRDPADPDKAATIWHLGMIPENDVEGEEIDALQARFRCFVRLDRRAGAIHSRFATQPTLEAQNTEMAEKARSHAALAREWASALQPEGSVRPRLARETGFSHQPRSSLFPRTAFSLRERLMMLLGREPGTDPAARILGRMCRMVTAAMVENGDLAAGAQTPGVQIRQTAEGLHALLDGASRLEESWFHDTLSELLRPVENPRYLIVLRDGLFRRHVQYFPVPQRFDRRAATAQIFWRQWQRHLGKGELVYARTIRGRGILQAARLSTTGRRIDSATRWR